METILTKEDCDVILESLKYARLTFENYQKYPSPEFKQKKIDEVVAVIAKVSRLKSSL